LINLNRTGTAAASILPYTGIVGNSFAAILIYKLHGGYVKENDA
jgi:hypothetical protein